ncbi:MAG TPA: sensor histidine kinase [Frankiaceae bacterium]|nr:sensor histidine kinase [Frankiaceae bacterium]
MSVETIPLRDATERRTQIVAGTVRLLVAMVAALLAAVSDQPLGTLAWLVPAVMLGALAASQPRAGWFWRWAVLLELVIAAAAIPVTGGSRSAMLPYLLGPMFGAGFRHGARVVAIAGGVAAAMLAIGLPLDPVRADRRDYVIAAAQWCVLGVLFGFVAAWARVLATSEHPATHYAQVSRLLGELRARARRLPGSLDPVSAAETLLDECAEATPYDRGAVFLPTSADRLAPLVVRGAERIDLDTRVTGDGHLAQAWQSGAAVREVGRRVRSGMASLLVVPLPSEEAGSSGLLVLESAAEAAFPANVVQQVGQLALAAAGRLESALLFDEIRRIATVEERQRVAREIHDGIAQELVYVGYELDALGAELDLRTPAARDTVRRTREHVTRIISELRLSIFTLRTAPEPGGLGAALGEYVRSVAGAAGIAVHITLSEDPARLPADAEAELLRIAQEAVSNARKHADARNLWVTLEVNPPHARLRVEDDGHGIDSEAQRGFGLDIMRERAERLGATLRVSPRHPTGTCVEVHVGGATG